MASAHVAEPDPAFLAQAAGDAAGLLRLLADEDRLLLLGRITAAGEVTAAALAQSAGLPQPAVSQHLALLHAQDVLATRREGRTLHYRLADPRARRVLEELRAIFRPSAD